MTVWLELGAGSPPFRVVYPAVTLDTFALMLSSSLPAFPLACGLFL